MREFRMAQARISGQSCFHPEITTAFTRKRQKSVAFSDAEMRS
jgi:hypothetical protein